MMGFAPKTALDAAQLEAWREGFLKRIEPFGQAHVLRFWNRLSVNEKNGLRVQLEAVDFELVDRLANTLLKADAGAGRGELSVVSVIQLPKTDEEKQAEAEARRTGEEALRAGRIGAFLVAGGQGTRLGFDGPKGAFPIGPVSKRTLFQIHAEKIQALRKRYASSLPWIVMTSSANDEVTKDFLKEKNYFGLGADTVRVSMQENMPAVDLAGKLLLATPSQLALNPNGHGGSIKALYDSGAVGWLRERGIDTLFYFQVDNVLTRICDPVFLGYHLIRNADMSSKVLRKRDWKEPIGVIGAVDGKLSVIEYSDIPDATAQETLEDGRLRFWAGSIAIHVIDVDFIERLNKKGFALPYHMAKKRAPCVGPDGKAVALEKGEKNAIKFETFVFDALSEARASVTVETERGLDFAPVKNSAGDDSVDSARACLNAQYADWLEAAGHKVPRKPDGSPDCVLEISPVRSLGGEGLEAIRLPEIRPGGKLVI